MKKSLFLSTLLTAAALSVPAFATDYTFSKDSIPSADGITAGGDGSQDNPYYITACGSGDRISISTDIFTDTGTTVYLGTEQLSFGAEGVNSFFASSFTAACNIVIGSAGVYLTNGSSGQYYNFTGTISGDGSLTVGYYGTGNNQGSTVAQHYAFTGDLSGWTGDITITTSNSYDYLIFGGTVTGANGNTGEINGISATQAATNTSVSGTGAISVDYGSVEYVYTAGANGNAGETLTVTNTSIEAHTVVFGGGVNYTVSSTVTGWDAPSGTTSATSSTLTISNTGTTTFSGKVSGFDIVTVGASSTLAVGNGGSLDLSGATVDLASAIQNSGTVTIDSSTVFVLDNLTYEGTLTEGATYTLITNTDSGSITVNTSSLDLSNVSSVHEITSATFDYTGGVLTVTVIELSDGLHGSGGIDSPYYTSGSGTITIPVSGDSSIFTGANTTVYLATDEHSFGTASMQIYWGGAFTAECDIVIGAAGVYITDGSGGQSHKFTGAISGAGDFTVTHNGSQGEGVNQDYCFTGDLSQWSGNFTIDTTSTSDYVCYGDGATVAATATNVTGTGAVSVATGTIAFDYVKQDESGKTGPDTVTIGNKSLTATTLEFIGDVTYSVDLSKTTLSATTLKVGESATLLISGSGTLTESSSSSSIAVSGTLEVAENATLTITKHSHSSTSVTNLVLGNGSTLIQNATTNQNNPSSKSDGLIIGTLTITSASSGQTGPSVTIRNSNWENYVNIGALIGENATLILTSDAASSLANVFELGTTTHEDEYVSKSQFTGTISISDTNSGSGRAVSLVISEENIAAGAVIEFGTEASGQSLSLGVNAERVVIAGLSTSNNGTDIVYSGEVTANSNVGANGENITSNSGTTNTLAINVADDASYSFHGVFLDKISLEKLGGGSQTITFESGSSFDGSIAVKAGTLALSGEAISSTGLTVSSGATLSIGNTITLAATEDVTTVSSTISGTLSVTETGSLALSGTVELSSAIQNSGTITIADGTSITVGVEVQTGEYNSKNYDYYTLIDGSNGSGSVTLGESVTFVINGAEITLSEIATLADGDTDWKGYISGGSLYIYAETSTTAQTADNLYWAGTDGNNTWSTSTTDTPWSASEDGSAGLYFADEANVIFGSSAAEVTTVTVSGTVTAGSTTINGAYTFNIGENASVTTGALTYGEGGSLTLTGSGSFVFSAEDVGTDFTISTSSEFTGTLEVAKGLLDLSKVSLGTSTKLVIDAIGDKNTSGVYETSKSNAILFDANDTTLANDLTIAGSSGGVILRSNSQEVTLSGKVTGATGTTLQLNGGGTANFTGEVSLSNYINYQGTSVFQNTTSIDTLTLAQNESGTSAVTFTGTGVQATVGTLVVDTTGTSGATKTLTISDGASLSVGTMTVNNAVAIAIDNGALAITTSATQGDGGSTSVTISNGGTLSLGSDVSLNVDVMEIVLGEANYDTSGNGTGTFAIVGGSDSSLTFTDSAAIKITVDSALASLLSEEGTYTFDIYSGLSLSTDVFDISDILNYSENVTWNNGVLTVVVGSGAIPEPSMFGVFFGLGALGLVATRRRRRAA